MEGEHVGPFNLGNPGEFTMLELAQVLYFSALSHCVFGYAAIKILKVSQKINSSVKILLSKKVQILSSIGINYRSKINSTEKHINL
jgi:hypothetical protein